MSGMLPSEPRLAKLSLLQLFSRIIPSYNKTRNRLKKDAKYEINERDQHQ